ncbi:M20/M25/M40 family metallo-hydrolase [Natronoglycomyces albus]|uniref:M20/M25/M40 family metallo-hydrolase n=1 Tax=Natronoglycomyces albus TaxID=2811108 RepID=A0A895XPE6_9ACTN|nr:M20/M25/M40 family metallo-hydrolase [Natronoglycomyces albus]QSB04160.1 M20/M25/M40 family metallo-hydrolase [Natronoglycomyces albus]
MKPLYVVKVGSSTLAKGTIFAEIGQLVEKGASVLMVAGGAAGIDAHYAAIGREQPTLTLKSGDTVRHCTSTEIDHIVSAYRLVTLPQVEAGFSQLGLSAYTSIAAQGNLVSGKANKPLRTIGTNGRPRLERDHRVGVPAHVDLDRLRALLGAFDVVCLSAPIADTASGSPLNADADVIAAALAVATKADHLRLVTGTAGLLADPNDPQSTLPHLYAGEGAEFAGGRMKQKVRAAEMALSGSADVAITGPDTLSQESGWTRFWPAREPADDLQLLTRAAAIPSVSGDERELALYLRQWCTEAGIDAQIDPAGNLVATKGNGPRSLLLMGHMDTVPFHWPTVWEKDLHLFGRGTVDAKGSLVNFMHVLRDVEVPADAQLRVVGAVEEEISSSKGAFYVRDHYRADAVVIGEPSGSEKLTLGYFGLFKLRVTATVASGHSAGKDAVSAPDALATSLSHIRSAVLAEAPEALHAVIDHWTIKSSNGDEATGILNFRLPPGVDVDVVTKAIPHIPGTSVAILRATPGFSNGRSGPLAKAFTKAFRANDIRPRYVVKKGTADMNTLATTWADVPMLAYGPGDATLDHTNEERIGADEFRTANSVLSTAVANWFTLTRGDNS